MVGTLDYIHIMLDDDDGMTTTDKGIECLQQLLDIVEMQARSRFIEYKDGRLTLLDAEEIGQLYTLVLTTRTGS